MHPSPIRPSLSLRHLEAVVSVSRYGLPSVTRRWATTDASDRFLDPGYVGDSQTGQGRRLEARTTYILSEASRHRLPA
jgi:hypothetical protein